MIIMKKNEERRCKSCGAFLYVSQNNKWKTNGTILSSGGQRLIFFQNGFLNNIFQEIEKRINASIGRIIFEAKRQSTKDYIDDALSGWKSVLMKNRFLFKKGIQEITKNGKMAGYGHIWLKECVWKKHAIIVVNEPYNITFLAGDVGGAIQGLMGMPVDIKWERRNGKFNIRANTLLSAREISEYRFPAEKPTVPGNIVYNICPECGIPKEVTENFEWDWEKGLIFNTRTKKRWIIMGSTMPFDMILGALEKELGNEIPQMVAEIQKEYAKNNFHTFSFGNTEDNYQTIFNPIEFGVRGWGNPVEIKKEGKNLKAKIDNPFSEPVLAGIVAGIYEKKENIEADVQWTPNVEGYTIITVTPKV